MIALLKAVSVAELNVNYIVISTIAQIVKVMLFKD